MNSSINNKKNAARTERLQKRLEAGLVATHFPKVASIVISMTYKQKGIGKALPRTVYFSPGSHAFFIVDCLTRDCVDGGFDLTQVIAAMIGNRTQAAKGELNCHGDSPSPDHAAIVYEVAIQYT